MARAAKSIHHLRSQVFSFTQPHQLELAGAFDRDSVPRCDPYVARFTEPDSNLFSVRTLGVNRESQRSGKAVMQQTAPGIAALHYQISIFLAFIPHLSATLRGVDRRSIFEQKPLDSVEQQPVLLVLIDALADGRERLGIMMDQLLTHD